MARRFRFGVIARQVGGYLLSVQYVSLMPS